MASIVVQIPSIQGESKVVGYEEQLDALAIRESIQLPAAVTKTGFTSYKAGRSKHSDIVLTRVRDRASPKLAEACSAGQNLGTVMVTLFRQSEGANVVYMRYALENAFVSRYENDTVDETGAAFLPHFGSYGQPLASSVLGSGSLVEAPFLDKSRSQVVPRPVVGQARGVAGAEDLERVAFNSTALNWEYMKYQNGVAVGSIMKEWSIQVSQSAFLSNIAAMPKF